MRRAALLAAVVFALAAGMAAAAEGVPGRFDYYVLSLSWSPAYCAAKGEDASPEQCGTGRRFGFVVHGLWPQYRDGGYPASCRTPAAVPEDIVGDMLPLMPSRKLIDHEWRKHGTCSGLDVAGYFQAIQNVAAGIRIPDRLRAPDRAVAAKVGEIEALFGAANPGLGADGVSVTCSGKFISEVRICLDRDLTRFRDCGRQVRDRCPSGPVVFRPVR